MVNMTKKSTVQQKLDRANVVQAKNKKTENNLGYGNGLGIFIFNIVISSCNSSKMLWGYPLFFISANKSFFFTNDLCQSVAVFSQPSSRPAANIAPAILLGIYYFLTKWPQIE